MMMSVGNKTRGDVDTGPHRFEMQKWIACAPFEELLGIEIVSAADGRATLTMPFVKSLAQGGGLLHGGALVSLADTAVVMAIKSILAPQTHFATIDLQTQFLHPVKQGTVRVEAEVVAIDSRVLHGQATVYDETGRASTRFKSTFKIARDTRIKDVAFISPIPP
jgi:uncharacterized protein (TIGR00369 family)